jgi:hypothetical protein
MNNAEQEQIEKELAEELNISLELCEKYGRGFVMMPQACKIWDALVAERKMANDFQQMAAAYQRDFEELQAKQK